MGKTWRLRKLQPIGYGRNIYFAKLKARYFKNKTYQTENRFALLNRLLVSRNIIFNVRLPSRWCMNFEPDPMREITITAPFMLQVMGPIRTEQHKLLFLTVLRSPWKRKEKWSERQCSSPSYVSKTVSILRVFFFKSGKRVRVLF